MKNPCQVIQLDKYTKRFHAPDLLLMNRNFDVIGKIPDYTEWNISLVANGLDEISFSVHKTSNGVICPVWDKITDLKIIEVRGFGRFEIDVNYQDSEETIKVVHGVSLEAELCQIPLYEFHVNDEDVSMEQNEYNQDDFDSHGDFIPTVFYNSSDKKHSLLDRVLADKAPHWSIGHVPEQIILEGKSPELSSNFQRTYTCDGDTIYDFLTGQVAEESNVVFIFDTMSRTINCYNMTDGDSIGEDTEILVSKRKLAQQISIESNKDSVKNCFRVEGGDDVITDVLRAANMNGSNYIYHFADFQLNDMPVALANKIRQYGKDIDAQRETYYGENGIYTRLLQAYKNLDYYESSMMPETNIEETTAKAEYESMKSVLAKISVAVSSFGNYTGVLFAGVTNNVLAMAQILIDSRYKAEVVEGTEKYDNSTHKWTGGIRVYRFSDKEEVYPDATVNAFPTITVQITDNEKSFAEQKLQKALSKAEMADVDVSIQDIMDSGKSETDKKNDIKGVLEKYSLNRLKSFCDGYSSCVSILMGMNPKQNSIASELYDKYSFIYGIAEEERTLRENQVNSIKNKIQNIEKEQAAFQKKWDFRTYIGEENYKIFCSYRREDSYRNDNYISDGLSTAECVEKARELLEAADGELAKACVLQRRISVSLNNLFAIPEFEPLYEKFALFNFIRVRTEDEVLKMRIIQVDFSGESFDSINVTFSDKIESADGTVSDLSSVLQQAQGVASSFQSSARQAEKGAAARNIVGEMYANGINTAKMMLKNNDNNEVTVTSSGILCRRMDDEGFYGEKQIRITGNVIGFTRDGWKSVEMAIGETFLPDKTEKAYGIVAENIVGKLLVGEQAVIGNQKGNVVLNGDGITIYGPGGVSDDNKVFYADTDGNLHLKGYVDADGGVFRGTIYANEGEFHGGIEAFSLDFTRNGESIGGFSFVDAFNTPTLGLTAALDKPLLLGHVTDNDKVIVDFALRPDNRFENPSEAAYRSYFRGELHIQGNVDYGTEYGTLDWIIQSGIYEESTPEEPKTFIKLTRYTDTGLGVKFSGDNFTPLYDNTTVLGASNYRWNGIYTSTAPVISSDVNEKTDIENLNDDKAEKLIMGIKPVSFKLKSGTSGRTHYGLIAQDVENQLAALGMTGTDFAGFVKSPKVITKALEDGVISEKPVEGEYVYGLRYSEFIAPLIHVVQKQDAKIKDLESEISMLKERVNGNTDDSKD